MIENEIYCYITSLLKWNTGKTNDIVGKKKCSENICIPNLKNKRKSIFARAIIKYEGWKKIAKEMGKILIKSYYMK